MKHLSISIFNSIFFFTVLTACQGLNRDTGSKTSDAMRLIGDLLNNTMEKTQIEGSPSMRSSKVGNAVYFDGDDRIEIEENSLLNAEEFTVEVIFFPNDVYPNNTEPRFLHIESADKHNRVTIELRLNNKHEWYLDAYLHAENDNLALIDSSIVHPTEHWYHAAITYKDSTFKSYVNGVQELQGNIDFTPFKSESKMSLGARLNKVHWFSGGIYSYRITRKLLSPEDFELLKPLP